MSVLAAEGGFWVKATLIAGGVFLGAILLTLLLPAKRCPRCQKPLPKVRLPRNVRQAVRGGHTCRHCGCEIDASGRVIR